MNDLTWKTFDCMSHYARTFKDMGTITCAVYRFVALSSSCFLKHNILWTLTTTGLHGCVVLKLMVRLYRERQTHEDSCKIWFVPGLINPCWNVECAQQQNMSSLWSFSSFEIGLWSESKIVIGVCSGRIINLSLFIHFVELKNELTYVLTEHMMRAP